MGVLDSKTESFSDFDIDAVTITRPGGGSVQSDGSFGGITVVSVWSGNADLQEGGGSTYINPAGAVEVADARLFIDATSLPEVQVGDKVTRTSDSKPFTVASVSLMPFAIPHLEIKLKRGPLDFKQ